MSSRAENEILQNLKTGRWSEVERTAFGLDDGYMDFRDDILKITRFWQKRVAALAYTGSSSGRSLYQEWESFYDFCQGQGVSSVPVFLAVKSFVLKRIIDFLTRASRECDNSDKEQLILLAYALEEADQAPRAVETLNFILTRFPDDADYRVYSLLGDIYSLDKDMMKNDYAVCYFNELFMKCADRVQLDAIDSPIIARLEKMVRGDYFSEDKIRYWIPVYGYLFGGLNIRRRLEYDEYKKIQNSISSLENDFREGDNLETVIPKLLNLYFWIFDYYVYQMRTPEGVHQVYVRVLQLCANLTCIYTYEESGKKIGFQAERVLDAYLNDLSIPQ